MLSIPNTGLTRAPVPYVRGKWDNHLHYFRIRYNTRSGIHIPSFPLNGWSCVTWFHYLLDSMMRCGHWWYNTYNRCEILVRWVVLYVWKGSLHNQPNKAVFGKYGKWIYIVCSGHAITYLKSPSVFNGSICNDWASNDQGLSGLIHDHEYKNYSDILLGAPSVVSFTYLWWEMIKLWITRK